MTDRVEAEVLVEALQVDRYSESSFRILFSKAPEVMEE